MRSNLFNIIVVFVSIRIVKIKVFPSITPIVLPETGGTGTYWYTMGGVLLTAGAAFLIYKKHMQKGGRRIW